MSKITITFDRFENGCKFFYPKGSETEIGVIHQMGRGVSASIFLESRGAWSEEIPVGEFAYTKDCESFLRKLFNDKQRLVDVIETYRTEQNNKLDALTNRLTNS